MDLSLLTKTRSQLDPQSNRTRTIYFVVLVTTVVIILRFTSFPTTAVVCLQGGYVQW
jgi:hypothetical protein